MSNGTESNNLKGMPEQEATASDSQRLNRIASKAIVRDQAKALRCYLADGLDPDSDFYNGPKREPIYRMLHYALSIGSFECFKVLVDSGAEVRAKEIEAAITWMADDTRALQYLLDSGKFDPSGGPDASISWCEYAEVHPHASCAKIVLMKEICEREKHALSSSVAPPKERGARRTL